MGVSVGCGDWWQLQWVWVLQWLGRGFVVGSDQGGFSCVWVCATKLNKG